MSDDTTRNDDQSVEQEEQKETPKAPRKRRATAPKEAKVTGLVNSMYLKKGDYVHVQVTDQMRDLEAKGFVKIELVEDNG